MEVKFKIYDAENNTYIDANTLEEAQAAKTELVNKYLTEQLDVANGLYGITAINVDNFGNELWSPIHYNSPNEMNDE